MRTESEVSMEQKWLLLEKADNELMEVGIMLELCTNAATEFEDEERLPYAINLACRRINEIRHQLKQAMEEWQLSGQPYLDDARRDSD